MIIKKNLLWSLLAMMMVAMFSFSFTACSSDNDDDDEDTTEDTTNRAVGTWSVTDHGDTFTATFKANGTGTWMEIYDDGDKETISFTYKMTGTYEGYLKANGEEVEFEISGKKMKLYFYDEEDGEYTMVLTKQ